MADATPKQPSLPESTLTPAPAMASALTSTPEAPNKGFKKNKINYRKILELVNGGGQRLDLQKTVKIIYPLTIGLIILILVWFMSFLYNNVYLTMAQAKVVSGLKTKVLDETLNQNKFAEVTAALTAKKNLANWSRADELANPFAFGPRNNYLNGTSSGNIIEPPASGSAPLINSSSTAITNIIASTTSKPATTPSTTATTTKKTPVKK